MLMIATLPINLQIGDTMPSRGPRLVVMRGAVKVFDGDLRPLSVPFHDVLFGIQLHPNTLIWELPVANQIKVITRITKNPDESYSVEWDNADGQEFQNWEAVVNWANVVVTDPEFARRLSLASVVAHSPDGTGLAGLVGTKVTIAPYAFGNEATVEVPPQ